MQMTEKEIPFYQAFKAQISKLVKSKEDTSEETKQGIDEMNKRINKLEVMFDKIFQKFTQISDDLESKIRKNMAKEMFSIIEKDRVHRNLDFYQAGKYDN